MINDLSSFVKRLSSVFLALFSGLWVSRGDGLHIVLVSIRVWESKPSGMERRFLSTNWIEKPSFDGKTRFRGENSVSRIAVCFAVTPLTKAGDLTIILLYGVSERLEKSA